MASTIYPEILVLADVLVGYVLCDHFGGHLPELQQKYPLAHRRRLQNCFFNAEILPADDVPSSLATTATVD
jgi:hypothetical protein